MSTKSMLLAAGMAALSLSACGGDDEERSGERTPAPAPVANEITLKATSGASGLSFDRRRIVTEPGRTRIVFVNDAGRAQNVRIQNGPRPNAPGAKDIGGTGTVGGGEQAEAIVDLKPGTYTYLSAVGQYWRQLHGKLIVR